MALRKIVTKEDPILRKVCKPVLKVNDFKDAFNSNEMYIILLFLYNIPHMTLLKKLLREKH